ncbi:hypothetical protein NMY22_g11124 [Coprinellus aureogranulatus]|nr:hypothetical protein NMY22_g11124 [Coprinellus aureogranulatus]
MSMRIADTDRPRPTPLEPQLLFEAIQDAQHGDAISIAPVNERMTFEEALCNSSSSLWAPRSSTAAEVMLPGTYPWVIICRRRTLLAKASVHIFAGAHHQAIESADIRGAGRDMYNAPTMVLNIMAPAHIPSSSSILATGSQRLDFVSSILAPFGEAPSNTAGNLMDTSTYNPYLSPVEQGRIGETLKCVEEIEVSLARLKTLLSALVSSSLEPHGAAAALKQASLSQVVSAVKPIAPVSVPATMSRDSHWRDAQENQVAQSLEAAKGRRVGRLDVIHRGSSHTTTTLDRTRETSLSPVRTFRNRMSRLNDPFADVWNQALEAYSRGGANHRSNTAKRGTTHAFHPMFRPGTRVFMWNAEGMVIYSTVIGSNEIFVGVADFGQLYNAFISDSRVR